MANQRKITPRLGYRYSPSQRILPRQDYKPPSLHTRKLPQGSKIKSIDAEWCPVCLGRKISEREIEGKPIWHCEECNNEW